MRIAEGAIVNIFGGVMGFRTTLRGWLDRGLPRAPIRATNVFTPTSPARLNFVDRGEVQQRISTGLEVTGAQMIVFGESGAGKSSLIYKELDILAMPYITSNATSGMTLNELVLSGFSKIDEWSNIKRTSGESVDSTKGANVGNAFVGIRGERRRSRSRSEESAPIVAPQLTIEALCQLLAKRDLVWVIEDFHLVGEATKRPLSEALKVMSDVTPQGGRSKIICVGATDSAAEVVEYNDNMANRILETEVPTLTDDQLRQIVRGGGVLLNVDFSRVENELVAYSAGVASICHNLALQVCWAAGVRVHQSQKLVFDPDHLDRALEAYATQKAGTFQKKLDLATSTDRTRRFDNRRDILTAMAALDARGATRAEILQEIRRHTPTYPQGNLTQYLRELTSPERGNVLRRGHDQKYRFDEPLLYFYARYSLTQKPDYGDSVPILIKTIADEWTNYVVRLSLKSSE